MLSLYSWLNRINPILPPRQCLLLQRRVGGCEHPQLRGTGRQDRRRGSGSRQGLAGGKPLGDFCVGHLAKTGQRGGSLHLRDQTLEGELILISFARGISVCIYWKCIYMI